MITLLTGAPGSGKTLYCIDKIIQPVVGTTVEGSGDDGELQTFDRTVYTNINGLLLPHEAVDGEWLQHLHENKKPGAFVVFDEVQRVWPNRPTGSKKPAAVEYLETHRHDGIDIVILTQNPQLLDPAVRALVGRHLHMRRLGGTKAAMVYEWDACSNALNYKSAFRKSFYRYSRKVFELYKSAKIHTKQTRKMPGAVWILGAALAAGALFGPGVVEKMQRQASGQALADSYKALDAGMVAASGAPAGRKGAQSGAAYHAPEPLTAAEYLEAHRPRMKGLPHTAERYDAVTQPTRAPIPAACLESRSKGCRCFTQDGTALWVPDTTCRQIVVNGYFYDFNVDGSGDGSGTSAGQPVHAGSGASSLVTTGAPPAGAGVSGLPGPDVRRQLGHVPGDEITPMDVALASKARTGGNRFAPSEAPQHPASSAASGKPAT